MSLCFELPQLVCEAAEYHDSNRLFVLSDGMFCVGMRPALVLTYSLDHTISDLSIRIACNGTVSSQLYLVPTAYSIQYTDNNTKLRFTSAIHSNCYKM